MSENVSRYKIQDTFFKDTYLDTCILDTSQHCNLGLSCNCAPRGQELDFYWGGKLRGYCLYIEELRMMTKMVITT